MRLALAFAVVLAASSLPRLAVAAGVAPAAATPVQREQAQSRFLKGRDLYNARKYDAALVELRASLDIVASPNTRLTLGRCLRDMGRTVAAYVELGRTAVEAKELVHDDTRYEKAGIAAAEERAALAPQLGFVEVSVLHPSAETKLTVSGEEVRRGGWAEPIPVLPGTSDIVVETPGHAAVRQPLTIAAGEKKTATIDAQASALAEAPAPPPPAPREDRSSSLRPVAFASAGIAAAGLATFLVAGALANGTYSDLESACGGERTCPPGHEGDISRGKTQQTFANVGLVVFGVAAAASVTLFVVGSPKTTKASAAVALSPAFMTVRGTF